MVFPTSTKRNFSFAGALTSVTALGVVALTGCTASTGGGSFQDSFAMSGQEQSGQSDAFYEGPQSSSPDVPVFDDERDAAEIARSMSVEQKAAALLMVHFPGVEPGAFSAFTAELQPAGIILMGDNTELGSEVTAELISAAQSAAQWPLLIAIDQEGGTVSRLSDDPSDGPEVLRTLSPEEIETQMLNRAEFLHSLGINTNFGIVADVTGDPNSFIWQRVLGTDAEMAATNVAAAVKGESEGDVYSTLKHFPGHGATIGDSHNSIPETDLAFEEWEQGPGLPFQAGIDAGAELVMMGHLAFTDVSSSPASLSSEWVDILRNDMGFDGVIVVDDMRMLSDSGLPEYSDAGKNAVRALAAGNDLILYIFPAGADPIMALSELVDAVVTAVEDGTLDEEELTESVERVLELRLAAW